MANEMRLIDANALKDSFCQACSTNKRYHRTDDECRSKRDSYGNGCFKMRLIDQAPTLDAAPVVHGQWEKHPNMYGFVRCSECRDCVVWDEWVNNEKWKYCPNCGAKMDGA